MLPAAAAAAAALDTSAAHAAAASQRPASPSVAPAGDAFVPLVAAQLVSGKAVSAAKPVAVPVNGHGGVPASGVGAVVLEVQESGSSSAGQLVVYPAGSTKPGTASLSFAKGTSATELATVAPGSAGAVDVALSAGSAKVTIGVVGYDASPGATMAGEAFVPVTAARLASLSAVRPGSPVSVTVTGKDGIPGSGVGTVIVQVSATNPTAAGSLAVFPAGKARPLVQSVSYRAGAASTGLVAVPPGSGGKITLAATGGTTGVTVDIVGYDPLTGSTSGSVLVPVKPTRIVSTVTGLGAPRGPVGAGKPLSVAVTGTSVVPASGASAVLLEVTAAGASKPATVTVYPGGAKEPAATSASLASGGSATALVPVTPGAGGKVSVALSAGQANVTVDEVGYYIADRPPAAVTGLKATTTTTSASLSWTDPATAGFADVVIRRATGSTPPATVTSGTAIATLKPGITSYTDSGLGAGTTYSYAVFARDSVANTAKAADVTITTSATPPPAPGPVTGLTATPAATSIALSWDNPPGGDFTGVMIRRAVGSVPPSSPTAGTLVTQTAGSVASYRDTGLAAGTTYSYALFAFNSVPEYSAAATITAATLTPATGPVTGVTATASATVVTLSWTNPSDSDFAGVMIRRAVGSVPPSSPTAGTLVTDTSGSVASYSDTALAPGTTYSYALFAHNAVPDYAAAATVTETTATVVLGTCTDTFTGSTSSVWSDPTNWSTGTVPGGTDWACIPATAGNLPATVNDSDAVDGLTNVGGVTVNGTLDISDTGNASTSPGPLTVDPGGSLGGNAALTISGSLSLAGGFSQATLAGPGTVTVMAGGVLQAGTQSGFSGGSAQVSGGSLVNDGAATIGANTALAVGQGASFVNAGTVVLNDESGLSAACGSPSGTTPAVPAAVVTNTGSITVTSAAGSPATLGGCSGADDQGRITVSSGALNLNGAPPQTDSVDTGTVLAAPMTVDSGGSLTVSGNASLQVAGNTTVGSGGSLSATGPVTINSTLTLDQATAFSALTVNPGGILQNPAAVTASGSLSLVGGSQVAALDGPGTVTVSSGGSLKASVQAGFSGSAAVVAGGSLVSDGTATLAANMQLVVDAGASFVNAGTLALNDGTEVYAACGIPSQESESGTTPAVPAGLVTSTGSIMVTSAASSPAMLGGCSGIDDPGTITVSSGQLRLDGSPLQTDTIDTGTVLESPTTIDAAAKLTVPSGSSLDVMGNTTVESGGTLSATGPVTLDSTLTLDQATTFPTLTVDGSGVLQNPAAVTVTGTLSLIGGSPVATLDGPGTVTVSSGGSLKASVQAASPDRPPLWRAARWSATGPRHSPRTWSWWSTRAPRS